MPLAKNTQTWIKRPQEEAFLDLLRGSEMRVWPINGPGGAGKSSLLQKFLDHCKNREIPALLLDPSKEATDHATTVLSNLHSVSAPNFKSTQEKLNEMYRSVTAIAGEYASQAEDAWALLQQADEDRENVGLVLSTVKGLVKLGYQAYKSEETQRLKRLAQSPEESLWRAFKDDVEKKGRGVILIDTYEKSGSAQWRTRLRFALDGDFNTPQGKYEDQPYQFRDYIGGVANFFNDAPVLMVFAGRVPRVQELGMIEPKFFLRPAQTNPFDDAEISAFFSQYLPDEFTPPDGGVIKDIQKVTHGNPFLVERLARLIVLERQEDPSWDWSRWESTCGHFQGDDRYGLLLYVTERLATHIQPGDEDYWRLALPRLLHRGMAEILFPRQEGKPLFGPRLIEAYEQAGIVYRRATGDPDQYLLPDETRSALMAKARRDELWLSEIAGDLHSRLAKYFDKQHGIRTGGIVESEVGGQSLNRDHPALIEAAYHVVMNHVPSRQEKNKVDPERFWRSMAGSIRLNNLGKRLHAAQLSRMSQFDLDHLLKNFDEEAGLLDKHLSFQVGEELRELGRAGRLVTNWLYDSNFLLERIRESQNKAFWLSAYAEFLENQHRNYDEAERYYKRAVEANPNHANNLGNYALFLKNRRRNYGEAERYYKLAVEAGPNHPNNLGNYAAFLMDHRRDNDEAERYYKLAVEADPNNANNLGNYAVFLEKNRHDYGEAERFYKLAIEADPNHANNLCNYATFVVKNRRDNEEAERFFNLAVKSDPNNANSLCNYAVFLENHRRDNDKAERYYKLAIKADPKNVHTLGNYAAFLMNHRCDNDEAERYYKLAIEADSNHARNLGNYALFLEKNRRDYGEAERVYKLAIEADPNQAKILSAYAAFLMKNRRDDNEAERYYKLAVEIDPNDANHLGNYAVFLEKNQRDNDEAERFFKLAINADPNHANNLGNYAVFFEKNRRDNEEAERYYKLAIKADPNHARNLGNYAGFLIIHRRRNDEAERLFGRAIEADPNNTNNLGKYAVFLENHRCDNEEAERYYKLAIKADPNDAHWLGAYALFLKKNRRDDNEAERYHKLAVEADPNDVFWLSEYAVFLQAQRGNYDEAERFYRRAIALNPADANSRGNLAQIMLAQGRKEEGREMIAASFGALADNISPGLLPELWFYRYAHFGSEWPVALSELKRILLAGNRSPGWSLRPNIERAEIDGHPNVALLKTLARVINEEVEIEGLETDGDWRAA
jgi:Tfp pilus assembly protein PilF